MPTSRGSCTGSAVLLGLALVGNAPAALVFREEENVLTLGALVAARMFDRPIAVVRLETREYDVLARSARARILDGRLEADGVSLALAPVGSGDLALSASDRAMLAGHEGAAAQLALEIIATMAEAQGASRLIDATRVHIDGCIYASPACLTFAEHVAAMAAKVRVPTTMNAISVDYDAWRSQGVPDGFGMAASRLADAYVSMGARPTFTCAPYLLDTPPAPGETIAWAESNAVIYANSVLGARTVKHPDFLDLFIALTGRAPEAGVYLEEARAARRIIDVSAPAEPDDAYWPLLGWLVGKASPDRIPLVRGLDHLRPGADDLKALCAAFGTTSGAPMLHLAGITPEADREPAAGADRVSLGPDDFRKGWRDLNRGGEAIDLVALGSPHLSLTELRRFAEEMGTDHVLGGVAVIATLGRVTRQAAEAEGLAERLAGAGVQIVSDLCWCSITEPVFPPAARTVMTNSGKYAHYGPSLSGRELRFGSLADCAAAAKTGVSARMLPGWLRSPTGDGASKKTA